MTYVCVLVIFQNCLRYALNKNLSQATIRTISIELKMIFWCSLVPMKLTNTRSKYVGCFTKKNENRKTFQSCHMVVVFGWTSYMRAQTNITVGTESEEARFDRRKTYYCGGRPLADEHGDTSTPILKIHGDVIIKRHWNVSELLAHDNVNAPVIIAIVNAKI